MPGRDKAVSESVVMESADGDDPGGMNCFKCKALFEDAKSIVQCVECKNYYHGKCENVDLRGFHMRRLTWKCGRCSDDNSCPRPRKRSRVEDGIDQSLIEGIHRTLSLLLKTTNELNDKVDKLVTENQSLKVQIAELKKSQIINPTVTHTVLPTYASTAAKSSNNSKVLLVKQKGQQKDVKQVKKDLQDRVNPEELGIGVSMGRPTRDGGLVLTCGNEREISAVQSEIQTKLGSDYQVDRPKTREHRIKVVGIHEDQYESTEEQIIERVAKQNDLRVNNKNFKIKILRRTQLLNRKFNLIVEADSVTYNSLIENQKLNLGWGRYWVYNDYGIIRCYNCNKYGHFQKECRDKKTCAKCNGEHDIKDCQGVSVKCTNCVTSNEKYKMNLKTDHVVWDHANCETFKRIEKSRKNKFLQ